MLVLSSQTTELTTTNMEKSRSLQQQNKTQNQNTASPEKWHTLTTNYNNQRNKYFFKNA
jgi:hypothetical protein